MERRAPAVIAFAWLLPVFVIWTGLAAAQERTKVPDGLFPEGVRVGFVLRFATLPKQTAGRKKLMRLDHEGRPTLLIGDTLFILDEGSVLPVPLPAGPNLRDFAWMDDGALVAIKGDLLGFPGPGGMAELARLPDGGMRLAPGDEDRLYLFGGASRAQRLRAYLVEKGRGLTNLVEMPFPITALAGDGQVAFVAIGRSVMFLAPDQPVSLVFRPRFEVNHLAYAPPHGLFYATGQSVGFVLSPGRGFTFLHAAGVQPMVHGDDLYLLVPGAGILRASPISAFKKMAKSLVRAEGG